MRRVIASIAGAAALLGAAPAQALDVPLAFDNAVLDTPATPNSVVVSPDGAPITATADVDPATGAFTIDPANFDFPLYSFSEPIPGTIDVFLNAPATGQVDFTTGQVDMTADYRAEVTTQLGVCNVNTGPLLQSTENKKPLPGVRFPAGPTGVVSGPGAIAVSWSSLTASSDPGCNLIGPFVSGPGGFWISKGIAPPAEEPDYEVVALGVKVKPKVRTAKKNKRATFNVTVRNPGDVDATGVKLCAKVGKGKKRCVSLGIIAARAKEVTKVTARARRTSKIVFTAKGTGVKQGRTTATLKIKKAKKRK